MSDIQEPIDRHLILDTRDRQNRMDDLLHEFMSLIGFKAYSIEGRWHFTRIPMTKRRKQTTRRVKKYMNKIRIQNLNNQKRAEQLNKKRDAEPSD